VILKQKNGTLDCFLETKHFKSLHKKEIQVRQQTIFKRKMAVKFASTNSLAN